MKRMKRMTNCEDCKKIRADIRRWFRTKMKIAGSEGTRYWITRIQRLQVSQYHELLNEIDALRQRVTSAEDDLRRLNDRPYTPPKSL